MDFHDANLIFLAFWSVTKCHESVPLMWWSDLLHGNVRSQQLKTSSKCNFNQSIFFYISVRIFVSLLYYGREYNAWTVASVNNLTILLLRKTVESSYKHVSRLEGDGFKGFSSTVNSHTFFLFLEIWPHLLLPRLNDNIWPKMSAL